MKRIFLFLAAFLIISPSYAQGVKWNISKSEHFIIYYKNAPEDLIARVATNVEGYYNEIADNLGFTRFNFWLWDNRAKIYVYDNAKDYQVSTGLPQWSGGGTQMAMKTISTYPGAPGFFERVLPHEMGHIIFREFVGFNNPAVPLWLDEGVAMYQERDKSVYNYGYLRQAMAQGTFMNITQLSAYNVSTSTDQMKVQLYYIESLSIVTYLIREFGRDRFVIFCQNLRDKLNLEHAIASSYDLSNLKELDSAWQAYVRK